MARPRTTSNETILERATELFWRKGFEATSIGDLVAATGANRFGLYGEFGDKRELFLRALDHYADSFVDGAFGKVEATGASLAAIRGYFAELIDLAEEWGLPGPGCFMANAMTEIAPRDKAVRAKVRAHFERLSRGFARALANARDAGELPAGVDAKAFAHFLAVAAQGLWSFSRICRDAGELRRYVATLLAPLEKR